MENINEILERQDAHLRFKDGKVQYFSISTQHSEANTIEEAIKDIIEADKRYDGKSSFYYAVKKLEEKTEKELSSPEYKDINITRKDIKNVIKFIKNNMWKDFYIKN